MAAMIAGSIKSLHKKEDRKKAAEAYRAEVDNRRNTKGGNAAPDESSSSQSSPQEGIPGASSDGARGEQGAVPPRKMKRQPTHVDINTKTTARPKDQLSRREFLYATFEDPSFSIAAKCYSILMIGTLLVSTVSFLLDGETGEHGAYAGSTEWTSGLYSTEFTCVVLFSMDFLLRLLTCPRLLPFLTTPLNIIDVCAVLPFWLELAMRSEGEQIAGGDLGQILRLLRLIRVLRLFKFGRYSVVIQLVFGSITQSLATLAILYALFFIAIIIISALIKLAEEPDGSAPECFGTILLAFWWALVTMTTVGYGDCSATTNEGKAISVLAMILGLTFLALPISIVGNKFSELVDMYEEDASILEFVDLDGDGTISELELREFLVSKKKAGLLRKDVDTNASRLIEHFSSDANASGSGTLRMAEFAELRDQVLMPSKGQEPAAELRELRDRIEANDDQIRRLGEAMQTSMGEIKQMLNAMSGDSL